MTVADSFDAPTLFQTYIARTAAGALAQIQAAGEALPPAADRDLALNALNYALKLPAAWPQTSDLLTALAPKMEQAGSRHDWMIVLEEGIRSSQEQGDLSTEAELRLQKGILHQLLAEYDDACEQYQRSESCFEMVGDQHGRARVRNRRAYVLRRQREWAEAESYARSALETWVENDPERGYSLLVLGLISYDQRKWADAVDSLSQSLQLFKMGGNERFLAWTHTNLGLALWQMKDLPEAEAHLIHAITLFETIDDPVNRAVAQMNLGNIYMALDQPQQALDHYLEAEPIFRKTGEKLRQAMIYNNIGKAHRELKQLDDAVRVCIRSIELFSTLNRLANQINVMEGLGQVYLDMEQYRNAADILQNALEQLPNVADASFQEQYHQALTKQLQKAAASSEKMHTGSLRSEAPCI